MHVGALTVWAGDTGQVRRGVGGHARRHGAGWNQDDVSPVEDIVFRSKSRTEQLTEQLQDQSESLADAAATVAEQLRERVGPAVGQATENAMDWARPHFEHGVEAAAPRLESAVNGLAPKVDTARDKIVDELIPRLAEAISAWAATTAAAKDEAVSRGQGAAAVLSGDAVASHKGKKTRVLLVLGLLTAAAAAVMAVMKKSAPKDDPWTTPLADRYGEMSNGQHSAASPRSEAAETASTTERSEIIEPLDETGTGDPMDLATEIDLTGKDRANKDLTEKNTTSKNGSSKNGSDKNLRE